MTAQQPVSQRQLIPRWRALGATVQHGELDATLTRHPTAPELDLAGLHLRAAEYVEQPSLSFAADLISASIVLGPTPETVPAAEMVLAASGSPPMLRDTASWLLEQAQIGDAAEPDQPTDQELVAHLRTGLKANPRNAVRWVELARLHVAHAQTKKARDAMRVATALAPQNRFVLRSAARLWLHIAESDRAIRTFRTAGGVVLADPWILASEIATRSTTGRPVQHVKAARDMLKAGGHLPFSTSELAGTLATLELEAGNDKRARRLFNTALIRPNENTVAQAQWASNRITGLHLTDDLLRQSAEARARTAANADNADATLSAAWDWLRDQPFSIHPAGFGSYQASMHRRFEEGIRFAAEGMRANPHHPILLNNRAFCLASLDRWQEAQHFLDEISPSDAEDRATVMATQGLVRFRAGDLDAGRALYTAAIDATTNPDDKLRAQMLLAAEEIRAGLPDARARADDLVALVEHMVPGDLHIWILFVADDAPTD